MLADVQVVRMFMYCNTIVNLSDILHTPFTGRVCEYTYRDCAVDTTHSLTTYTHLYSQTCRLEEDRYARCSRIRVNDIHHSYVALHAPVCGRRMGTSGGKVRAIHSSGGRI